MIKYNTPTGGAAHGFGYMLLFPPRPNDPDLVAPCPGPYQHGPDLAPHIPDLAPHGPDLISPPPALSGPYFPRPRMIRTLTPRPE